MNSIRKSSLALASLLVLVALTRAYAASEFAVEIDLQDQRAYLLRDGRMVMESPISSGRANYRTPTGNFEIIEKDMDHHSSLYGMIMDSRGGTLVSDADADMPVPPGAKFVNAPMHYFMRFTNGIGMHAGYLPGYAASHGCVRLPKEKAIAFFQAVEVGTPVTVFGTTAPHSADPQRFASRPRLQFFAPHARWWW
jgi:lipoprotein-anchoring transpeptidase ErfK/SrfK